MPFVCTRRRAFGAAFALAFGIGSATARAATRSFSGTIASAAPGSIVVRSSGGPTSYAAPGNAGAVLAAALKLTGADVTISGDLDRPGSIAAFSTSVLKVTADVAGRTATIAPGVTVTLDWGLVKPAYGKAITFTGRLALSSAGLTLTVTAATSGK